MKPITVSRNSIEDFLKNSATIEAIREAREGKLQGPLDVSSVEAMYKSMGIDEDSANESSIDRALWEAANGHTVGPFHTVDELMAELMSEDEN